MTNPFYESVKVYPALACLFGPPLIAILGLRHLIRIKKRSMVPRVRCGIAACRILFYGLPLVVISASIQLYDSSHYANDMLIVDLLTILWGIPLLTIIPLAFLTWMVEIILFKTRPKSKSRPTPLPSEPYITQT